MKGELSEVQLSTTNKNEYYLTFLYTVNGNRYTHTQMLLKDENKTIEYQKGQEWLLHYVVSDPKRSIFFN